MLSDFIKRFGFDLTDTFAGDGENFADFLESVGYAVGKAESHVQNLLFARRKIRNNVVDVIFENLASRGHRRRNRIVVRNEIRELALAVIIMAVADRRFK